jgi:hypothetical protein
MKTTRILKNVKLTYFGESEKFTNHTIKANIEIGMNTDGFLQYWICSLTKDVQFEKSTLIGRVYDSTENGITATTFDFIFENIPQFQGTNGKDPLVIMIFKYQRRNYMFAFAEKETESNFKKLFKAGKAKQTRKSTLRMAA